MTYLPPPVLHLNEEQADDLLHAVEIDNRAAMLFIQASGHNKQSFLDWYNQNHGNFIYGGKLS